MRYYLSIALPEPLLSEVLAIEKQWQGHSKSTPHLTLVSPRLTDDLFSRVELTNSLVEVARTISPFAVIYGSLGWFNGWQKTIYLKVNRTVELTDCQRRFSRVFKQQLFSPDAPERKRFTPHITLADHLDWRGARLASQQLHQLDLRGVFTCREVQLLEIEPTDKRWKVVVQIPLGTS